MKIIITGASGMVGEGVLLHCLQDDKISSILMINRRKVDIYHPKLQELLVKDFNKLEGYTSKIAPYDACFFCAGISSVGMNEKDYAYITHTTTLAFAKALLKANSSVIFNYISGKNTNSQGKQMWQRVKGKTEEALRQLGFKGQYNFRPGFMKPLKGQENVRWFLKPLIALFPILIPSKSLTLREVGNAMINVCLSGYERSNLEIQDIKRLAKL